MRQTCTLDQLVLISNLLGGCARFPFLSVRVQSGTGGGVGTRKGLSPIAGGVPIVNVASSSVSFLIVWFVSMQSSIAAQMRHTMKRM